MSALDPKISPLEITNVPIDEYCVGARWATANLEYLAHLVALVTMGQAEHAAYVLRELNPAAPPFTRAELTSEAVIKLTVQKRKRTPRIGYPKWQRDGLVFEIISWVAAHQSHASPVYLKAPHISSTSQGLDGLMIELSHDKSEVNRATIFEDKCSDDPRKIFVGKVMPTFLELHSGKRAPELLATAAALIKYSGISEDAIIRVAGRVLDKKCRRYRSALAVTTSYDSGAERQRLFQGYHKLEGLQPEQRLGASFVVECELRDWFDALAERAISVLRIWEKEPNHV